MAVAWPAVAQEAKPVRRVLFTNVNVFDGVNEQLIENASVLVEGNLIKQVSTRPISADGASVIDGGGRGHLMPGMIDAHWHTYCTNISVGQLLNNSDMSDVAIAGLLGNEQVLMRGFTTVGDIGGNPFAVKKAIDVGTFPGPAGSIRGQGRKYMCFPRAEIAKRQGVFPSVDEPTVGVSLDLLSQF